MRIKINFTKNDKPVPFNSIGDINTYIHKCLGENNKYHDTVSDYSVSKLIGSGSKLNPDFTLDFPNGAKIIVSSIDESFLEELLIGLGENENFISGMKYSHIDFINETFYDGVNHFHTISPILLKERDRGFVTVKDADFFEVLTERTKGKLLAISKKRNIKINLSDFNIVGSTNGKNKTETQYVGNVKNVGSICVFTITCSRVVAELLTNVGIGQSTGSCFGSICKVETLPLIK